MRYVKVLVLVLLFFFVMLFFVQNQAVFSQAVPLKLNMLILPPMESSPLPVYSLLLICFLLGALCTMAMLIWDRLSISAKLTMANMRIRGLEKDLQKARKNAEATEGTLNDLQTKLSDAETRVTETQAKAAEAETRAAEAEARAAESAKALSAPTEA